MKAVQEGLPRFYEIRNNKLSSTPVVSTGGKVAFAVVGAIVLAVCGVLFWLWGMNVIHWFTADFREFSAFWILTFAGVVAAIAFGIRFGKDENKLFAGLALASLILGLIAGIFVGALVAPYQMAKGYYEASTTTISNSVAPSYSERAPYELAVRTSDKSLMNITGDSQITKSLADEGESGEWNTLVVERGMFKGYEAVQNLNLPLYGASQNSNVKFCEFSESATLRDHGAMPHNNLSRAIFNMVPLNVDYEESDFYSYCNDANEPVVVVPLKQIDGFMFPTWKAYGVATYNGKSGVLNIVTDAQLKEIPGPTYPASLAASQRNSLIANGTWWEMVGERVSGFVAASDNTEVNLRFADNSDTEYVTSLMPRGSSTSIVAVSHVSASMKSPGGYNPLIVEAFSPENVRPANSTLVDDLKTRYSYMPDMANDTVQVFEITSGKDGGWIASLGREQSVNYRAYISPAGDKVELRDRNNTLIAQGSATGGTTENGENTGEEPTVNLTPTGVSTLSTEELNTLGKAVMEELAKRAK
jgi:hypothetical protein